MDAKVRKEEMIKKARKHYKDAMMDCQLPVGMLAVCNYLEFYTYMLEEEVLLLRERLIKAGLIRYEYSLRWEGCFRIPYFDTKEQAEQYAQDNDIEFYNISQIECYKGV